MLLFQPTKVRDNIIAITITITIFIEVRDEYDDTFTSVLGLRFEISRHHFKQVKCCFCSFITLFSQFVFVNQKHVNYLVKFYRFKSGRNQAEVQLQPAHHLLAE